MTTPSVVLYTRVGCHLCEEAASGLDGVARELGFEVEAVDVDLDLELLEHFNDLVPVIAVAGEMVTSAPIDLDAVRAAVRAAG